MLTGPSMSLGGIHFHHFAAGLVQLDRTASAGRVGDAIDDDPRRAMIPDLSRVQFQAWPREPRQHDGIRRAYHLVSRQWCPLPRTAPHQQREEERQDYLSLRH